MAKVFLRKLDGSMMLADILASAPKNAHKLRAERWDEMLATGNEA